MAFVVLDDMESAVVRFSTAHQPPRCRVRVVAGALFGRLQGHCHRRHPRPVSDQLLAILTHMVEAVDDRF